jgi:hypothetical protein
MSEVHDEAISSDRANVSLQMVQRENELLRAELSVMRQELAYFRQHSVDPSKQQQQVQPDREMLRKANRHPSGEDLQALCSDENHHPEAPSSYENYNHELSQSHRGLIHRRTMTNTIPERRSQSSTSPPRVRLGSSSKDKDYRWFRTLHNQTTSSVVGAMQEHTGVKDADGDYHHHTGNGHDDIEIAQYFRKRRKQPPKASSSVSLESQTQHRASWSSSFVYSVRDRAGWLIGLLILQSLSSFIIARNEQLLQRHLVIVRFLTMLVGAGGNAGNQTSVGIIRGLATGTVHDGNISSRFQNEIAIGMALSGILGLAGAIRAAIFGTPFLETCAISASLMMIVFLSVVLGTLLPLLMKMVGIDPAHSSTTIQVIMDILGVTITVQVSGWILSNHNTLPKVE